MFRIGNVDRNRARARRGREPLRRRRTPNSPGRAWEDRLDRLANGGLRASSAARHGVARPSARQRLWSWAAGSGFVFVARSRGVHRRGAGAGEVAGERDEHCAGETSVDPLFPRGVAGARRDPGRGAGGGKLPRHRGPRELRRSGHGAIVSGLRRADGAGCGGCVGNARRGASGAGGGGAGGCSSCRGGISRRKLRHREGNGNSACDAGTRTIGHYCLAMRRPTHFVKNPGEVISL